MKLLLSLLALAASLSAAEFRGKLNPVVDMGTHNEAISCDYPKIAYQVARTVAKSKNDRGMLVCMSGVGQAMAANKVKGAYAALCHNVEGAKLSREHNNANILVLGSKFVKPKDLRRLI